MSPTATRPPISFRLQTAWVIGLVAVALVAGLSTLFSHMLAGQAQRERGNALAVMARGVATVLERGMLERRRQVWLLAQSEELWAEGLDSATVARALARTRSSRPYAAWVGVADERGIVRGAADGVLLGKDVSQRDWFRAGLLAEYVGDVHPARLLADMFPKGPNGEPVRFVDFSAPIRLQGQVRGVVAMHGSWEWASDVVRSAMPPDAAGQHIEVFIHGKDGSVLFASGAGTGLGPAELKQALQATRPDREEQAPDGASDIEWQDGQAYVTAASALPGQAPGLHLGWQVVVRQPAPLAHAGARQGAVAVLWVGGVAVLLAAAVAWLGAGHLSTPLAQISRSAAAVERGEPGATIPALRHNAEISELSSILASMTDRLVGANAALELRVRQRTEELSRSHEELERVSAEQHAMLDNDIVGIVRTRGRVIVWMNRAVERMLGYGPAELTGQSSRVLYADGEDWERVGIEASAALRARQRYRTQLRMRRKDGDTLWIDLAGARLAAAGGESLWLLSDISAIKAHQQQIEHIAFHDPLTGVANRLLLADRLQQALTLNARLGRSVGLCYLDLDGFKPVNDQFGHSAGDELLREIARRLQASVRSSDTVARWGGDEFVIVLTPVDGREECAGVVQRVMEAVNRPVRLPGEMQARVSVSIGMALSPDHAREPSALMRQADEAMYRAKGRGKNQVCWHGPAPTSPADTSPA